MKPKGLALDEKYTLPDLQGMDGGSRTFADVRAAWSPAGIGMTVHVQGKKQTPWCRETRLEESDSLHVWVDTRDTHNVHRASRFCHYFVFMPSGGGRRLDEAFAEQRLINRAREHAKPVRQGVLQAASQIKGDGYLLSVLMPASALTGFESRESNRLGFQFAVLDREFGLQTFSIGLGFPFQEDPSVWGALELIE